MIKFNTLKTGILVLVASFLFYCTNDSPTPDLSSGTPPSSNADWLIPANEVRDGGPGKDGIPSVDQPEFELASATTYLEDNDLIVGIKDGNVVRAYPHPVLDWHEIFILDGEN